MKVQTDTDTTGALLKLLNEARLEADDLRRRLERTERTLLSTRLIMTHELKRPTTAIRGYLDLALEHSNPGNGGELTGAIKKAQQECRLLDELNTFFLELLKTDRRRAAGVGEIVDLGSCLDEIVGRFPENLDARSRVVPRVSPDAKRFRTDPNALKIVLENIIENALLYSSPAEPVEVHVERDPEKRGSGSTDLLKIRVMDRGRGIPEEFIKKVFKPFVTLHAEIAQGVGLGLTLVRSLVELHGGSVFIKSEVGHGTTVHVTIPEAPETDRGAVIS
jgi:two-component system sensor histidine kinase VicK